MQKKPSLTEKQKKIAAGCALAVFILLSAAVCWFVGRPMIRFARQPELFRQWVDGLGLWGKAAYVGMCILQVMVAIIPGEPLEICGGYAFGGFWGSVLCMLGLFLGSVIVFWLVRKLGQPMAEIFFPPEKLEKLHFLKHSPKRKLPSLAHFHHTGHAEGSAVLLCGADGHKLGHLAAAVLRGAAALRADLHGGRQCAGRKKLPVCRSRVRRNAAFVPGRSAGVPPFVPKA